MNNYQTNLTDNQWKIIEKFVEVKARKRKYPLRSVFDAISYECPSKFQVLPKRWIVERSFAWLENFRRLTIDYEFYSESSVAMIQLAFSFLILNKIFH